MVPYKGNIISHSFYDRIYEGRIFEDSLTFSLCFWCIKVALEEYHFQKVEEMYLHCMVLIVDDLLESTQDRINNDVSNFIGSFPVLLKTLQYQFHELTSRSVHSLGLLVKVRLLSLRFSFDCLRHYELECNVDYDLQILILASKLSLSRSHPIEHL
jgi:hypothetical protein